MRPVAAAAISAEQIDEQPQADRDAVGLRAAASRASMAPFEIGGAHFRPRQQFRARCRSS